MAIVGIVVQSLSVRQVHQNYPRQVRRNAGLSQRNMAKEIGISPRSVGRIMKTKLKCILTSTQSLRSLHILPLLHN